MFTPKQLLINCATLLCLEHREGVATSPSKDLVNNVLNALPIPEGSIDHDHSRQTFLELRSAVMWLNSRSDDEFPSDQEALQQIQIACREENFLYEAIMNPLMERYSDVNAIVKMIQSYRGNLNQYLNDEKIRQIMKETHHRLVFKKDAIDIVDEVREMAEKLEPYMQARSKQTHPAMMGGMDFGEVEGLAKNFGDVKTTMSTEGALRTGWKGLNRALGTVGAFKRGEFGLIGGLPHNFKSGFMLSLFVHFALFNKPFLRDKTRKPLLYFITMENEIGDNLLWIYKYLKENDTGVAVIDSEIDQEEAAEYVAMRLRSNGFEVKMDRFDPTEFSCASLVGVLEGLMAEGYEIVGLLIDYLNMINKTGIDFKVAGDDIRMAFRKIRNFTSPL